MNNKYKYLIKNTGILTISNFSSKFLSFLLVPLYTSVLSTDEYGVYDLIISTISLLYPILTVNIVDAVMRFSMEQSVDKKSMVSIAMRIVYAGCAVMAGLLLLNRSLHLWKTILGLEFYIFFYYVTYVLQQLLIQLAKGCERVVDMGIAGIIGTATTLSANIIALVILDMGLSGFFAANILGQLLPALYLFFRIRLWEYIGAKADDQLRQTMLKYSIPLILTTLGWWANSSLDKYTVALLCGIGANGLLSVAYKIPSILSMVHGIFIQAWQISAVKEYGDEEAKTFYRDTFDYLNAITCIGCGFLILLTRPIAYFLYLQDFYSAWKYVPFLLLSIVLNMASGYLGPILSAQMNSKAMAKAALYGVLANAILNVILVWLMGVQGATVATIISSYIIYIVRKKAIGDTIDSPRYRWIMLSWLMLLCQAAAEITWQSYWVSVLFVAAIAFLYKDCLAHILKKVYNIVMHN